SGTRRSGKDGLHQLHPADRDLHDGFLRAWVRPLRPRGAGRPSADRARCLDAPTDPVADLAAPFSVRAAGMALALADLLAAAGDGGRSAWPSRVFECSLRPGAQARRVRGRIVTLLPPRARFGGAEPSRWNSSRPDVGQSGLRYLSTS